MLRNLLSRWPALRRIEVAETDRVAGSTLLAFLGEEHR